MPQDSVHSTAQVSHQASTEGIELSKGESVLENFRPKLSVWYQPIGLGAALVAASVALALDAGFGPRLLPSVGLGVVFIQYALHANSHSRCVLTDKRIKLDIGVLTPHREEVTIDTIQRIRVSHGILPRLLGYGNIVVYYRSGGKCIWRGVGNPEHVAESIRAQMQQTQE